MESIKLGIYKHYKGGEYRVISVAKGQFDNPEFDMQDMVVYESVEENPISSHWVRPLKDFLGTVETGDGEVPRFTFIR